MRKHYTHDYNVALPELKKLIVDSGYSILRFSKDSGVSLQRLYRVFAGEHILNAINGDYNPIIWKCCDFLHIHPDEVVPADIAAARQRRLICEHVWLNRDTIKRKSYRIRRLRKLLRNVSKKALEKYVFHNVVPPCWPIGVKKKWLKTKCTYLDIVTRYYGLNGDRSETLEEIGMDLGVTRERVRQVLLKSLRLIRGYLVHYRVGKEYHVILWDEFMSYNNRERGVPKCTSPERLSELYHGCVCD